VHKKRREWSKGSGHWRWRFAVRVWSRVLDCRETKKTPTAGPGRSCVVLPAFRMSRFRASARCIVEAFPTLGCYAAMVTDVSVYVSCLQAFGGS
jgi:hypothetical protein